MSRFPQDLTDEELAVQATVAYSDVFDMPVDAAMAHRFMLRIALTPADTESVLARLAERKDLGRAGELFHLPGRDHVLEVYADRTARAATMWRQAEVWGRRIGRLPFVRMVAVTGGLAVDSVADHDDIDYFIVVRPGRLWLTRLLVVALGRLAGRRGVELCPNYMVSERAVEVEPRSLYVARELAQMVAIVGPELCAEVRRRNGWMYDYLPNAPVDDDRTHATGNGKATAAQRLAEAVMLLPPFGPIERWEMKRKIAKLTTVESRRGEVGVPDESAFSADVCKGHVAGNAGGIERAWRDRLADLYGVEP